MNRPIYEKTYADIGVGTRPMTHEMLIAAAQLTEPLLFDIACDLSPLVKDGVVQAVLPRPRGEGWQSVSTFLRTCGSHIALSYIPLWWQLSGILHTAARAERVPLLVFSPPNDALAIFAFKEGMFDVVIASSEFARNLVEASKERQAQLPMNWFVVFNMNEIWDLPKELLQPGIRTFREIHLAPGMPILGECTEPMRNGYGFHLSTSYAWQIGPAGVTITSKEGALLPLIRYTLPFLLEQTGTCGCGVALYARI